MWATSLTRTRAATLLLFVATAALILLADLAAAGISKSEVLFRRGAWEVRVVAFDDGSFACNAEVGSRSSNFLIWADTTSSATVQFYNKSWSFEGGTADVRVRIDGRPYWTMNNAKLKQNSVLFQLNDEKASYRFLREVMRGNRLKLYSSSGSRIETYSLSGSNASILALSRCVDALKENGDGNPFN